MGMNIVHSII
ncbi:hypothetical protein SNE40_018864 [Patella caerulea]|uniref:Uncharacterized protein n=1 Tax=Patella caerulea TaxID=87958 RepID=A0AAN8J9E5_PATCE